MSKAITEKMVEAAMTSMFGVYDDKRNYDAWVPPHWEDARRKLSAALSAALSEGQAQQSVKALDRSRATEAAVVANHAYGQWMPERWLHLFLDAYEDTK